MADGSEPQSLTTMLSFASSALRRSLRCPHPHARACYSTLPLVVRPSDVNELVKNKQVLPLDVSWHMPNSPRSAIAEYLAGPRVLGAKRFDLDQVAELEPAKNPLGLDHMLPSPEAFREAVESLAITSDTHVLLYDTVGVFSSPRALYTFNAFGHTKASVLDGGLPRWIKEGGEIETGPVKAAQPGVTLADKTSYGAHVKLHHGVVRSYEEVVANAQRGSDASSELVLDARSYERYTSTAPEPRPGLSSGHIPHSHSLPFTSLLTTESGYTTLKPVAELQKILRDAVGSAQGWDAVASGQRKIVFSCGSGMTAAIGWLALRLVLESEGKAWSPDVAALYDESWTGYAMRPESEIVKSANPV